MNDKFIKPEYNSSLECVTWKGFSLVNNDEFKEFLHVDVVNRLNDTGAHEDFSNHLRGLALTDMGKESLEEILNSEIQEERDWAIGESLAESFLIRFKNVIFPWNMERDKRNIQSSLPGADLVGFILTDSGYKLLLGEVKTSSQANTPPNVMTGRSGLCHQLDNLATNMSVIYQLLYWLLPRVKGTHYAPMYDQAVALYLNSQKRDACLFGLLIRDTTPNELDLKGRGTYLGKNILHPSVCELIAIYLPYKIDTLPDIINEKAS